MKILRAFKCTNDHQVERLVENNVKEVTCWCKAVAVKRLSAPRCFGNTTGKSPSTRY